MLKETIAYHNAHYTFLDANKLFTLLVKRGLPGHIIGLLVYTNFYTNNFVRVSWSGVTSVYFIAVSGVKQGGVSSPVLFCSYIDAF